MAQAFAQKHMTENYGPYGSQNGSSYSFQLQEGEFIKEVIIRHGWIVDAIGFAISNPRGETYYRFYGGCGGDKSEIPLHRGEEITKLSGTYGTYENKVHIATLKIHTNKNPNGYGVYGRGAGVHCPRNFETPSSLDGHIVGFFGCHGNYLQSVGIIVNKERKQQATALVSMTNETNTGTLKYHESKDWSGSVTSDTSYPRFISDNKTATFKHQGSQDGSMAAVIYVGPDRVNGPDFIAWLVAWSVPGNTSSNKVYVDCGRKDKFKRVNWDSVRSKLRSSGSEKDHTDSRTGAAVYATIENDEPKSAYELYVTFSVKNND